MRKYTCKGNDGIEFGEYDKNQRLAEYAIKLGDTNDTQIMTTVNLSTKVFEANAESSLCLNYAEPS